jgi:Putative peptidoglycan binding domain
MKTKSFLVCFMVIMMATSVAMAGGRHGNFGGGFARGGTGSFHGGNWNHCHGGHSSFVFIGGFPFFGSPYGYGYGYPYGYGYGYGSGYYGYGPGYYGNGYYGNRYYGSSYYGDNSHQSSVARLQRQLARAGYYRGSIDGIMGPRTRYALRAYQHDHGTASL